MLLPQQAKTLVDDADMGDHIFPVHDIKILFSRSFKVLEGNTFPHLRINIDSRPKPENVILAFLRNKRVTLLNKSV